MPGTFFYHVSNRNRFGILKSITQRKKYCVENIQQDQDLKLAVVLVKKSRNCGIKYNVCKFLEITSKETNITNSQGLFYFN